MGRRGDGEGLVREDQDERRRRLLVGGTDMRRKRTAKLSKRANDLHAKREKAKCQERNVEKLRFSLNGFKTTLSLSKDSLQESIDIREKRSELIDRELLERTRRIERKEARERARMNIEDRSDRRNQL